MPGTTRTFSYTLHPKTGDDLELLASRARKVLGWACDGDKRITCHGVTGDAVGVVQLNMTVVGRDRWRSMRVAQDILNMVTWGLAQPAGVDLSSSRPAVHDHRGYAHGRTKRWRERSSPYSD